MKYVFGFLVLLVVGAGLWYVVSMGKGEPDAAQKPPETEEKLAIVASFYPLQFVTGRIVGDRGEVVNLTEGQEPHDYELSTADMLTIERADLVVLQGADFEPWGDDIEERLSLDGVPVVIATAGIELSEEAEGAHADEEGDEATDAVEEGEEEEHGGLNPHTWVDPVRFSKSVENIRDAIIALDPDNASHYRENATALQEELARLDAEYKAKLSTCTLEEVITSHDAFGYVGERYGFEIHTIAGVSTQATPSAKTMASLKEEAEEGIGAILLEENNVKAFGETLARETGLRTLSIDPMENVGDNGDYLVIMRKNLDSFASALECNG